MDEATHELVAAVVTTNDVADCEAMTDLLDQVDEKLDQVSADGAYDKRPCYDAIKRIKARAVIPPRRDARIWRHGRCKGERLQRDENCVGFDKSGGLSGSARLATIVGVWRRRRSFGSR